MHDTTLDISRTFIAQLQHMRHLQSRVPFHVFSLCLFIVWFLALSARGPITADTWQSADSQTMGHVMLPVARSFSDTPLSITHRSARADRLFKLINSTQSQTQSELLCDLFPVRVYFVPNLNYKLANGTAMQSAGSSPIIMQNTSLSSSSKVPVCVCVCDNDIYTSLYAYLSSCPLTTIFYYTSIGVSVLRCWCHSINNDLTNDRSRSCNTLCVLWFRQVRYELVAGCALHKGRCLQGAFCLEKRESVDKIRIYILCEVNHVCWVE